MNEPTEYRAVVVIVSNALEHHVTLVYRTIFLGETLSLIDGLAGWSSAGYDTLLEDMTLTDLLEVFQEAPECILICADVHHAPLAKYIAHICKAVSPASSVFAYGRATTFVPQFFDRHPFDAVHISGDREVAIRDYLGHLHNRATIPRGVKLVDQAEGALGVWSGPQHWAYPKLSALPTAKYREYVERAYGPHYTPRISATIGKGCTWGCEYCGATQEEGPHDRRRPVHDVVRWASSVRELDQGFSLHMYHPNLFFDQHWIADLCAEYSKTGSRFSWRGVTTTVSLRDSGLVSAAGANGCRELAVGVESISRKMGRSAKSSLGALERAVKMCSDARIKLKALVMAGYPGQTDDDLEYTVQLLTELGLTVRFTGYTPLHQLRRMTATELDSISLERFDRRTFRDPASDLSTSKLFDVLTRDGGYAFPDFEN